MINHSPIKYQRGWQSLNKNAAYLSGVFILDKETEPLTYSATI